MPPASTYLQYLHLHPAAPPKPREGEPCNGCGICCAAEPCSLSRLLLRQEAGPCRALRWREEAGRYVCGMLSSPQQFVPGLVWPFNRIAPVLFRRWIAAGSGCDSDAVEVE